MTDQPPAPRPGDRSTDGPTRRQVRDFLERLDPADVGGPMQAAIAGAFQRIYHHQARRTWRDTRYRGTRVDAYPTDLWVYQELVEELRPSLVVQTGTFRGGTALMLADRLQVLGRGQVVTIDAEVEPRRPQHPRLTYLTGRPDDPAVVREVRDRLVGSDPVLAVLGSARTAEGVRAELEAYAPLLPTGSVLVVEHTDLPGPAAAVRDFLAGSTDYEVDPRGDRHFLTQHPGGLLRRVGGEAPLGQGTRRGSAGQDAAAPAVRALEDLAFDGAGDATGTPARGAAAPGLRAGRVLRRHQDRGAGRGPPGRRGRPRPAGRRRRTRAQQQPRRGAGRAGRSRRGRRPARGRGRAAAEHAGEARPRGSHPPGRVGGDVLDHGVGAEGPGPRRAG